MSLLLLFNNSPPYHEQLVFLAKEQVKKSDFNYSIILVQMAIEYQTELIFDFLLNKKNVSELKVPIENLLSSYNLMNSKVRDLFNALSNNQIQNEIFWNGLMTHSKNRNKIVHNQYRSTLPDAENSIKSIEELTSYFKLLIT